MTAPVRGAARTPLPPYAQRTISRVFTALPRDLRTTRTLVLLVNTVGDLVAQQQPEHPYRRAETPKVIPRLTRVQLLILQGMADGQHNEEIGAELGLSLDTIKTHAKRLYLRLGVKNRPEAVATGFRLGLVDLESNRA